MKGVDLNVREGALALSCQQHIALHRCHGLGIVGKPGGLPEFVAEYFFPGNARHQQGCIVDKGHGALAVENADHGLHTVKQTL